MTPPLRARRDEGITLVELLVYIMFAVVILVIVGGILINSLRASVIVRSAAESTGSAQVAMQSLNRGVHNALKLWVSTTSDLAVLRSVSADSSSAGGLQCQAWVITADGTMRTTTSPSAIPAPTSAAEIVDWMVIAEGVGQVHDDRTDTVRPYFRGVSASGQPSDDPRAVDVAFTASGRAGIPTTFVTRIASKQPDGQEVSLSCF